MNLSFHGVDENAAQLESDALVVFTTKGHQLSAGAYFIELQTPGFITNRLQAKDLPEKNGKSITLFEPTGINAKRVVIVYVDEFAMSLETFSEATESIVSQIKELNKPQVHICLEGLSVVERSIKWLVQSFTDAFVSRQYKYVALNSVKPEEQDNALNAISFVVQTKQLSQANKGIKYGSATGNGKNFARYLGDLPPYLFS